MRHHSPPLEGCPQDGVVNKQVLTNRNKNKYEWFVETQTMAHIEYKNEKNIKPFIREQEL